MKSSHGTCGYRPAYHIQLTFSYPCVKKGTGQGFKTFQARNAFVSPYSEFLAYDPSMLLIFSEALPSEVEETSETNLDLSI